jgi:phospholipid/cholesterol/gamma-HCH transport system substrate-binding protein
VIVCDGTVLSGKVGASYEALLRSAKELADTFSDPEIVNNLKATLENATAFTDKAIVLSEELTQLTEAVQKEIGPLAASAKRATDNAGNAAAQIELTAAEVSGLIAANRSNINGTLVNINRSSDRLLTIMDTLAPAIQDSELIQNLEILSANAVAASANIRDITGALNTQENLVMLQQTLDSARNVFQSAQKILADVDELTGDPTFRNNLRNLVNGLSNLVSTTEFLEQQVTLAQLLAPDPGQPAAQVSLTALPEIAGEPVVMTGNPVLLSHNGQLYQLNFATPASTPPAPATSAP